MALFNKAQQQMVLDLLISENPGLSGAILGTNIEFVGTPVAGSGAATTAKLRGKALKGFTGVKSFTYNRIYLPTLFLNTACTLQQYVATTARDLVPGLNAKYGLNLIASEVVATAISSGATNGNVAINVGTTSSFVYYGSVGCTWTRGSMQLTDYYPKRSLTALTVPDLMLKAFQLDFSSNLSVLQAHDTSVAFTSASATAQAIVNMLATKTGLPVTLGATTTPGDGKYDLSGFTLSFTTPDILQDSRPDFRKIAVLTPPSVYGNQYAPIYLHYDKISMIKTASIVTVTELPGIEAPSQ